MASPTVHIAPAQPGDEPWLASMIAPLLDDDVARLTRALKRGLDVGHGLNPADAAELVEVLCSFGAQAALIEADRSDGMGAPRFISATSSPPAPLGASPTQPFDGAQLRAMLDEGAKASEAPPVLLPQSHSAQPIPPPLRLSESIPPVSPPPSAPPVQAASAPVLQPPRRSSNAALARERSTASGGGRPKQHPITAEQVSGPDKSGAQPPEAAAQPSEGAAEPPQAAPEAERPVTTPPLIKPIRAPRSTQGAQGEVPPWFPQMSIRPTSQPEETPGRSWLWIVIIMLAAGAAAWWLRSGSV